MSDRFLLSTPDYFGIEYEINPWMDSKNNVDHEKAGRQWYALYEILSELATVEIIDPQPNLPDMIFTANAGLIFEDKNVILSNFLHPERKGEEPFFKKWFEDHGYKVFEINNSFEGAGDAFIIENRIFSGYNQRTSQEAYNEIELLVNKKPNFCRLVDPYFYHLDTCFCPLRGKDALWYKDAFDENSQNIEEILNIIHVPKDEARKFACNAVLVNEEHVLIPSGCPQTLDNLRNLNYTPHELEMSEFIKSGGCFANV